MTRACSFSPDRKYRYMLSIIWDESLPAVNFVMLNPSTADEVKNDPTVERCYRRASEGHIEGRKFGALIVTNIFAWRSTNPLRLYDLPDPVGLENDEYILKAAWSADLVIAGWGEHGSLHNRGAHVKALIGTSVQLHYLKLSRRGHPYHPLYVSYKEQPKLWK